MLKCHHCKRDYTENTGGSNRGKLNFCTSGCLMDFFHPCKPKEEKTK